MSFTNNASNLTGKSTTNAFNIIAESLTVNKNTLCKGDLTVLGTTNIGSVSLENGYVNNLTVNNFTATNPVPIASGGTGLATIGAPNQVLTVNPSGTALIYAPPGLINPATITGTGFTGNPTLSFGLEADTGSLGRGFIRTGIAAVSGLCLGTSSATVLRLWSNFATDSNAEIINTNANFTYNSTGSSGVFQVLSGGGGISFTNSGIGTISMATSAGNLSMAAGAGTISLTTGIGATSITTGAGPINLTTGTGNISLTTAGAGIISITTAIAGGISVGAVGIGAVNVFGSAITLAAPVIYIGTSISPPIPSILTFACGAINGFTGAWDLTTAAFQLNAVSIQLNSTLTIALNNNTTINGFLSATGNVLANSGNLQNTISLNPQIYVFNNSVQKYGMDLGYNATFSRYRTRIFAPTGSGSGDIALSTGLGSNQLDFTDRLIVRGDTGDIQIFSNLNVNNGNIFTNQNIIGGIEIINSGNLTLSSISPGLILIRGGSGSIITLPDATTLIIGYTYTINNNSNHTATVNFHTSGTVGTVPALNAATVTCIATNSANGQWDIHITGPTTGTDWATPGQIGSAIPNTGAFTTLSATGSILANYNNSALTTTLNPGVTVFNNGVQKYGMDLGYNATSSRFRTRVFAPTGLGNGDIALSTGLGSNQSDFTDRLIVRGDTGNIEISNNLTIGGTASVLLQLLANYNNSALTTTLNPGVTVFNNGVEKYGMDLGYNATSSRFRTRVFAPTGSGNGDIALSTGLGSNQSDFTDRLIVRGDTGNTEINSPATTITGTTTTINGSSSDLNSPLVTVNNTATAATSNIASFLQPTLGLNQTVNIMLGRSLSADGCAQLQYSYNPVDSARSSTWGFYGLGFDGRIRLRPNQVFTEHISLYGRTRIYGDLIVDGNTNFGVKSTVLYNANGLTTAGANSWTNINFMTLISRVAGNGYLTWIDQNTGFRNDTGKTVRVTASFSCQRTNDVTGITAIRILFADVQSGVQDVSGLDAVSISANSYLGPGESLKCQIYQTNATNTNKDYHNVYIGINLDQI